MYSEDLYLSTSDLIKKYPDGHPEYTVEEWKAAEHTEQYSESYWGWVKKMIAYLEVD